MVTIRQLWLIYSLVKNKSVKLPFVTKKQKISRYIYVQKDQNNRYLHLLL